LLGNITLVQPVERLYNSTFRRKWDKTIKRIKMISPADLEEMDSEVSKLERYYEMSGMRKISVSLGTYPDDFASKIKVFRSNMSDTISSRFNSMFRKISDLIGDACSVSDFDRERKRFDEALVMFRMMRAFFRRWKLDTDQYAGRGTDFKASIADLSYRLAKKRMLLMKEHKYMSDSVVQRQKTDSLQDISCEVSKLLSWYKGNYLNVDSKNKAWIGSGSDDVWMAVQFIDEDTDAIPLERFRNTPSRDEVSVVSGLFDRFVKFYMENEIISGEDSGVVYDYDMFKEYAAKFSSDSDDADVRLKSGFIGQMTVLHKVLNDAKDRIASKSSADAMVSGSFATYFAPVDEIYQILKDGRISSEYSIHNRISGNKHGTLMFNISSDIQDGDIGFVFPLSKLVDGHRFYMSKDGSGKQMHLFSKTPEKPLKIDVRLGVFVAPKGRTVRYKMGDSIIDESSEDYFRKLFLTLAASGSSWFEADRAHNWLSRHCIFYDDASRQELLNMLHDSSFVSIMNDFTNSKYDNLALSPVAGTIKPSNYYVTHTLADGKSAFNVTLFEWERTES